MDDDTIYAGGHNRKLNAIDRTTREIRWTVEMDASVEIPKVTDDTVYISDFPLGSDNPSTVYAFDTASGAERWRFDQLRGKAVLVSVSDRLVFVGTRGPNPAMYALDAMTGEEQWRFEEVTATTNDPAVAHGTVYIASADSNVYALDVATGAEQWRFDAATDPFSVAAPAVDDDTVYAANQDTNLYALDAMTGDQRWQFEAATGGLSIPVVGGETVYTSSRDTNVYAVDATSGEEAWRFEAATESLGTPPVVVGDALYVSTGQGRSLYAVT